MNNLLLNALTKDKKKVAGRIKSIERVDPERCLVRLFDDNQRVYLFLNPENQKKMESRLFENAVFIGKDTLGALEADIVILADKAAISHN